MEKKKTASQYFVGVLNLCWIALFLPSPNPSLLITGHLSVAPWLREGLQLDPLRNRSPAPKKKTTTYPPVLILLICVHGEVARLTHAYLIVSSLCMFSLNRLPRGSSAPRLYFTGHWTAWSFVLFKLLIELRFLKPVFILGYWNLFSHWSFVFFVFDFHTLPSTRTHS